jgi:hypothetical protein
MQAFSSAAAARIIHRQSSSVGGRTPSPSMLLITRIESRIQERDEIRKGKNFFS